jgi:cadmium resistance protein CadD (predicted permease)
MSLNIWLTPSNRRKSYILQYKKKSHSEYNAISAFISSVSYSDMEGNTKIYRLPLSHRTDRETNISVASGSDNVASTGSYYDRLPSISTTIICVLFGVISISILFFVSNNSLYSNIYWMEIEERYRLR